MQIKTETTTWKFDELMEEMDALEQARTNNLNSILTELKAWLIPSMQFHQTYIGDQDNYIAYWLAVLSFKISMEEL